jgi:predicted transcriptional regulator
MSSAKEEAIRIVDKLPDDISFDDIIRELAFARMIERGLDDVNNGNVISNEEMRRRINSWRK